MDTFGAVCALIGLIILVCSIIVFMMGKFNGDKCFIIALIGTIFTSIGLFLS